MTTPTASKSPLEPRRRSEKALLAVIQQAYDHRGVVKVLLCINADHPG